ncbi:MAG TPA: response regulator [Thermoanaerobaculia bacterium]|nr:response regulator [Thermoanaerobaculia bacterium]
MSPANPSTARILVADDDQSIRQLLCTIVSRERFDVDCVADGIQAIQKLKENRYAVILLDLMMPRASGFEVIEYLKQHPPATKPIVLVITAYSDPRVKEVDASVVAGVLRKPFEVADLGSLIRLCIKGYFDEETQHLYEAKDRSIRDFVRHQLQGTRSQRSGEYKRTN